MTVECSRCGAPMDCNPQGDCWCKELPPIASLDAGTSCWCPRCLWSESAAAWLRKHREYVARDLALLQQGDIRINQAEGDATTRWAGRYQRELDYLDRLIETYERNPR